MKITRITRTKQGRFALFDDKDAFLFSVDAETLVKSHLQEGSLLDEPGLEALRQQSDTRRAKDKALEYLSARGYASRELYDKLCLRFDEHSAAAAVAQMQHLELLDDKKFALHRAEALARRNKSAREIARHLAQKGVDRDTIDEVLAQLDAPQDNACCALIRKSYLPKLRAGRRDLVIAALARRGFGYGDIKAALETCEAALAQEGEDDGQEY